MNVRIDILPDDFEIVQKILVRHVPEFEVRAFGSRTTWAARQYLDLDLILMTAEPPDIPPLTDLCEASSQSNMPLQVDIVDWVSVSESSRGIVTKGSTVNIVSRTRK